MNYQIKINGKVYNYKSSSSNSLKQLTVKRKCNSNISSDINLAVYRFDNFEHFCSFCSALKLNSHFSIKELSHSSLYCYKGSFFLVINNLHMNHNLLLLLHSFLREFSTFCSYTSAFEHRLKEYGTCVIPKNAINITLKFFK